MLHLFSPKSLNIKQLPSLTYLRRLLLRLAQKHYDKPHFNSFYYIFVSLISKNRQILFNPYKHPAPRMFLAEVIPNFGKASSYQKTPELH